uniref:Acyltransferase n=1 Tax=Panagrellus redivivus TaxID=6233 RepID=A0A7E4ZWY6_PANRE
MKYPELQGLRGIAILAVVLYHLWPKVFWNGYLGVDMFFVLSGFLMAETNLKDKSNGFTIVDILPFWYRRIRRIAPLAVLIVFATWIIVIYKLTVTNLLDFTREAICALSFSSNVCNIYYAKNYFDLNSIEYFKHYWSLSVEMQFYLIVPGLFLVLKHFPTKWILFGILPFFIVASVVFQTMLFMTLHSEAAFSLLPSRLWQFCGGICAFYARRFGDEMLADADFAKSLLGRMMASIHYWVVTDIFTVALIALLFVPVLLNAGWMMAVTVILAAAIITSLEKHTEKNKNDNDENASNTWILSNQLFLILGNASYAIYVVHWIVQHVFSIMSIDFELFQMKLYCFYTSIAIGILVHYATEKPLLSTKQSKSTFCIAICGTYAAILLLILTTHDQNQFAPTYIKDFYNQQAPGILNTSTWPSVASSLNSGRATKLALYSGRHNCRFYNKSDYAKSLNDDIIFGAELRGNGNLSMLVIGNSHAECALPAINAALGPNRYKELNMFGVGALTPFPGFRYAAKLHFLMDAVDHYDPDVIIFVFKYQDDVMNVPLSYPLTEDPVVKGIQATLDFLSNRSEMVFINGDHFQMPNFNIWKFAQAASLQVTKDYSFEQKYRNKIFNDLHTRWHAIRCPKCVILNMWPAFCSNQQCSPLDVTQTVPLFWDDNHVNLFGSNLMAPLYRALFEQKDRKANNDASETDQNPAKTNSNSLNCSLSRLLMFSSILLIKFKSVNQYKLYQFQAATVDQRIS